jgi:quercetin dioxygenase-like cupin family protein
MQSQGPEKSKANKLTEIIDYVPNSVVSKTIIRKTTGNVNVVAFDALETLAEKISPVDTFIQVIEGIAEVVIDNVSIILQTGQFIIIPANTSHILRAKKRFKMIATIINTGMQHLICRNAGSADLSKTGDYVEKKLINNS